MMKLNSFVLLFLIPLLLVGCSSYNENKAAYNSQLSEAKPSPVSISQTPTVNSDVNKPKHIGNWLFTLNDKKSDQIFDSYMFDFEYQGNSPAKNVTIKMGNGILNSKEYDRGEGGKMESTFPPGVKQIDVTISWTENNQSFGYSV